jgi:hypothetical protein
MKRGLLFTALAFVITLAVVFGLRASADALAVIIGVILGVVASVPTTFLITYALLRSNQNQLSSPGHPHHFPAQQPPVVVINAPEKPAITAAPTLPMLSPATQTRKWTVIGDEETEG